MNNEDRIAKLERELAELKAKAEPPEPKEPFKPKAYPKFDPTEGMGMSADAAKAMAWPDVKGVGFSAHAWAQTKRGEPGGFGPPDTEKKSRPVERGTGWINPVPMEPRGDLKWLDRAMDQQDRLDKLDLERRLKGER